MRIPRMQASPPQTPGVFVMRSVVADIEIPSDWAHCQYTAMHRADEWRLLAATECRAASGWFHFSNILFFRSPRDSRYAIKSSTSSLFSVSIKPSGIIHTFEVSIVSMRLRFTLTILFGSSMSMLTMIVSWARLTMRPVTVLPSVVMMLTAAYWSLMTLLGSTMDSNRSRTLKRPAAPVRSGPDEPPSL